MLDKQVLFRIFEENKSKFDLVVRRRFFFDDAKKFLGFKEILAITGVRRSGKTFLMFELMQELSKTIPKQNIVYLNFEDERLAFIEVSDLDKIFEYYYEFSGSKGKLFLFFDEIQNVPMWEKWLSRSFEKHKFVISGSNSNLLSSELSSAITGRYIELRVQPFLFKEIVEKKFLTNTVEGTAYYKNEFKKYLDLGGFPESVLYKKKELLREYYKNILFKDVVSRYNIKHKQLLEKLGVFLASNIGTTASFYALSKQYGVGVNTIKNYLLYLENSFLFLFIGRFDYSVKKQQFSPKKVFGIDIALFDSINFKFSQNLGRKIENIVLINLIANKKNVFYYKNKFECDFVINNGSKIVEAIQVCYDFNEENKQRELNGLIEACKMFDLKQGLLLTFEQEQEFVQDKTKIVIKPVWKWLLE